MYRPWGMLSGPGDSMACVGRGPKRTGRPPTRCLPGHAADPRAMQKHTGRGTDVHSTSSTDTALRPASTTTTPTLRMSHHSRTHRHPRSRHDPLFSVLFHQSLCSRPERTPGSVTRTDRSRGLEGMPRKLWLPQGLGKSGRGGNSSRQGRQPGRMQTWTAQTQSLPPTQPCHRLLWVPSSGTCPGTISDQLP